MAAPAIGNTATLTAIQPSELNSLPEESEASAIVAEMAKSLKPWTLSRSAGDSCGQQRRPADEPEIPAEAQQDEGDGEVREMNAGHRGDAAATGSPCR